MQERLLPHGARNIGINKARGKLIVSTDPDCTVAPDGLDILRSLYKKQVRVIVGGMDCNQREKPAMGIHLCKYHTVLPRRPARRVQIVPSANVAFPKRILEKTGLFKASIYTGDALLSWKTQKPGRSMGKKGFNYRKTTGSEKAHLKRYFSIIGRL